MLGLAVGIAPALLNAQTALRAWSDWTTFLGGQWNDDPTDIAVDEAGSVFVVGSSESPDFPTTRGALRARGRRVNAGERPARLGFVAKLSSDGRRLLYGSYIGGGVREIATCIVADGNGGVYIGGGTDSPDFPVSAGAPQARYGGGAKGESLSSGDGFLIRLDSRGRQTFGTFLGGRGPDIVSSIAIDRAGDVYVGGATGSPDFPRGSDAESSARVRGFVVKLDRLSLQVRLRADIVETQAVKGLAVSKSGAVYVTGQTAADGVLVKLDHLGGVAWTRRFGGSDEEAVRALDLGPDGSVFVGGWTRSRDLETSPGALQSAYAGGSSDGFVQRYSRAGTRLSATYFGANGYENVDDLAVDGEGRVHLGGRAWAKSKLAVSPGFAVPAEGATEHGFYARVSADGRRVERVLRFAGDGRTGNPLFRVTKDGRVAIDAAGRAYVVFQSTDNVPATEGAYQEARRGGHELLVMRLMPD